ncbi:cytochrome p450 protein [Rutstroemia sp. NJR-2017a BBW]|nr:cytochrome p450 protein [Rutstroemia sp. NJR-2017a BBW]
MALVRLPTPFPSHHPLQTNQHPSIVNHRNSFLSLRETYDNLGDTYVIAGANETLLRTTNAELIAQLTTRKNAFVKPLKNYAIMRIFGTNILTTEGAEWRRHKRVVGPSFSERSCGLVWQVSLREVEGMMGVWERRERAAEGKSSGERKVLRVEDTSVDTAILSLHVICAAGFGVPQLWEGEKGEKDEQSGMPDLSGGSEGHKLGFKDSLGASPVERHQVVYAAFKSTFGYLNELLEHKKTQMSTGEEDNETMDLMGNMLRASQESAPANEKYSSDEPLREPEIISNAFIFLLAGHETSANSIHFCFVLLAMRLSSQRLMQSDIDAIVGDRPPSSWSYQTDMPRLYNSMVGAVVNEQIRLIPAAETIPKVTVGDQYVTVDGREVCIPDGTYIHLNTIGTNRNPKYYPHSPSKISGKPTDLDDFVPERWILENTIETEPNEHEPGARTLYKPPKGAFLSFSEGARVCPGKKFAITEITAVLAAVFKEWSVELDVSEWASDEEVEGMGREEREKLYERASGRVMEVLGRCNQAQIVLKMAKGDRVGLRFVRRGGERFGVVE